MRHFDAHAYRTEDAAGVWDFARGCMRTYLILAEKARRFHEDPEIAAARAEAQVDRLREPTLPEGPSSEALAALRAERFDLGGLSAHGYGHERLDQLVNELLLGVR
jgi:xylose isomerase